MRVAIRLYGGLGNQIFQYAFGRLLISQNLAEVYFDKSWLIHQPSHYQSDIRDFKLYESMQFSKELTKNRIKYEELLNKIARRSKIVRGVLKVNFECTLEQVGLELINENHKFRGYYQNITFPQHIFEHLKSLDWEPAHPSKQFLDSLYNFENRSFAGIHIRGGDYLVANSIYDRLDTRYYKEAIKILNREIPDAPLMIFTDDKPLAEKLLPVGYQYIFISDFGLTTSEEFYFLTKACAHVIANSTFSYWAAAISQSTQIVVGPIAWYSRKGFEQPNYLNDWQVI